MKKVKNTLDGIEFNYYQRSCGNSTKQIDLAINLLYNGYKVVVKDHWEGGSHRKANEDLFRRILKRLQFEHNLDLLIKENKIKINKSEFTIELL